MRHYNTRGRITRAAYQTFAFGVVIAVILATCRSKNSLGQKVPGPAWVWLLSVKMAQVKVRRTTGTRCSDIPSFPHRLTRRVEYLLQRSRLCCSLRRLILDRRRVGECVRRSLDVRRLAQGSAARQQAKSNDPDWSHYGHSQPRLGRRLRASLAAGTPRKKHATCHSPALAGRSYYRQN